MGWEKGKPLPPEHRARIAASKQGVPLGAEHKKALRKPKKKRKKDQEQS